MGTQGQLREKPFRDALRKAKLCADVDARRLDKVANALVKKAALGEVAAIKEVADRLDGRVPYKIGGDEEGDPVSVIVTGVPHLWRLRKVAEASAADSCQAAIRAVSCSTLDMKVTRSIGVS